MSLALAEAMLDDNESWTKESLADRFVEVFQRDQRRGYTTYFLNVLMNSHNGKEMLSKVGGKSTKSGAAMRAGVLGLYPDISEVTNKAMLQATVTHDSWIGKHSSVGAALMTHYFYYNLGPREELCSWLRDNWFADTIHSPIPFEIDDEIVECWHPPANRKVRVHGWDCFEAAIYAIESSDSLSQILWQCVDYCGDVDTVAAIAMGPASCSREIRQDLPSSLHTGFESGPYGRPYLEQLDMKLLEKFPRS
jgi:ADP-ribosylglycohydrolase